MQHKPKHSHQTAIQHNAVAEGDAGSTTHRWLLPVLLVAQLMVILDITAVNIALPHIAMDLHMSGSTISWTITSYSLVFGSLLLFGGRAEFSQPDAASTRRAADLLRAEMVRLFPELATTPIAYAWGGNVAFTRDLLRSRGLDPASFILVQKPYMERRTFATFSQVWPGKSVRVTSPQISMDEYLSRYSHESLSADDVISIMVGDLQRIREYPTRGFQIPQEIPDDVWQAYGELVKAGFDRHLLRE